jgi:hypothetical protein
MKNWDRAGALFAAAIVFGVAVFGCGGSDNETTSGSSNGGGGHGAGANEGGRNEGGGVQDPLEVTSHELAPASVSESYTAKLTARGGRPPYRWSLAKGTLAAGLSLAKSGSITGKATSRGTSTFTVEVTDASSPPQTATASLEITVSKVWYVRPDGGTRYSAMATTGQCDGLSDSAYPGSGTNQRCAFSDYRYLYSDKSYNNSAWVISGGDVVVLRGGPWRVGSDTPGDAPAGDFCVGIGPACSSPPIPSGTAAAPTRILGENYANCSKKTEIFGGHGVGAIFGLNGASYVDLECLELTDHAQCSQTGSPQLPSGCVYGVDDYASNGITTDVMTHDITIQDLDIHGFTSRAMIGPIGGEIDVNRVRMAYNGNAGWDFDDGNATQSVNGKVKAHELVIEWNGCNEEYPVTHKYSAISCYDQDSAGYGGGIGTPPTPLDFSCDHCTARYNTQDGMDLGHVQQSDIEFTNSIMYGNMGGTFKIGPNYRMILHNNISLGNCQRMSAPIGDVPSTFNQYLSLWCRAGDHMGANFWPDASAADSVLDYEFNTFVGYESVQIDVQCAGASCPNVHYTFRNNLIMGYADPAYNGGQLPGMFYSILPTKQDHNLFYDLRSITCPTGHSGEICISPKFVNQPTFAGEASLDDFDFAIAASSPAKKAGVTVPGLDRDYNGAHRSNPPSIGAFE